MDVVLKSRIPDLRYQDATEIQTAFAHEKNLLHVALPKNDWEDMVRYACIYRRFQKIKWLNLPTKLPWKD